MVAPFDGYVETMGKVSSTGLVIYDHSRYSVPCELAGQIECIRSVSTSVRTMALMACHACSLDRK
jgi:hypothetical protein